MGQSFKTSFPSPFGKSMPDGNRFLQSEVRPREANERVSAYKVPNDADLNDRISDPQPIISPEMSQHLNETPIRQISQFNQSSLRNQEQQATSLLD